MERKGLIIGVVALAALGVALLVLFSGRSDERTADGPVARLDARTGRVVSASGGNGASVVGAAGGGPSSTSRNAAAADDAGAPLPRPVRPTPTGPIEPSRTVPRELPNSAQAADRSAGWRLGRTRRQLEIIQPRIAQLHAVLADLEQRGDAAAIAHQQTVIQRFETRLAELRADQAELEAQARRDGTLGEADRGYQDSDTGEANRAPARMTPGGDVTR